MKRLRTLFLAGLGLALAGTASAAGGVKHPEGPEGGFPFEGPLGKFEPDSLQRGFQVYKEVCSSCHGLKLLSYRNLGEPGGPFYDPAYPDPNDNPQVKAIAAQDQVTDATPDEFGDPVVRPARPSDAFKSPFANEQMARAANNGAYPPDFSVIVKARPGGADYIYNLLIGYPENPYSPEIEIEGEHGHGGTITQPVGQYYNPYMAGDVSPQWSGDPRHVPEGGFLAMPPQLMPDRVTYMDGTEATVEQMAYDVSQFLAWASEPKQTNRKSLGLAVMIYLGILAILLWFSYKRIWRTVEH